MTKLNAQQHDTFADEVYAEMQKRYPERVSP